MALTEHKKLVSELIPLIRGTLEIMHSQNPELYLMTDLEFLDFYSRDSEPSAIIKSTALKVRHKYFPRKKLGEM